MAWKPKVLPVKSFSDATLNWESLKAYLDAFEAEVDGIDFDISGFITLELAVTSAYINPSAPGTPDYTLFDSHTVTADEAGIYVYHLYADVSVSSTGYGLASSYLTKNGVAQTGAASYSGTGTRLSVAGGGNRVTLADGDDLEYVGTKSINAGSISANAINTRCHLERVAL